MLKGSADVVKYRVGVLKYYTSKWTGEREERLVAPPPPPLLSPGFDFRTWGPFLEVSGNLMGPKPYFKMKI